jgi:ribosomal-protein-alanine N-acetyltransferase
LSHKQGRFLVADLEGKVVGYAGMWLLIDEVHITTVAVAPEYRRQGIAWRLMVVLLEEAKELGATCSTLEVRAGNTGAITMYERLGYVSAAKRKSYYPDNAEDAVVMWLHGLHEWEPPS